MAEKVDLPDGAWAMLRDPKKVSERARRPVARLQRLVAGGKVGELLQQQGHVDEKVFEESARQLLASDDMELLDNLNDALIVALVESWSYEKPVTLEEIQNLPADAYDALKVATAPHVNDLFPNFGPSADVGDPADPTGLSAG